MPDGRLITEIANETGATVRQIHLWHKQGYLNPVDIEGPSVRRTWPEAEITVAKLMARLTRIGFAPSRAARIARLCVKPSVADKEYVKINLGNGVRVIVERGP